MAGITTFLDATQMPARTQDQQTFDNLMATFMQLLPKFGGEVNALVANLNSIAAGGAYAIPYTIVATGGDIGGINGGKLCLNNGTVLSVDTKDARGVSVAALLGTFAASTSLVKGSIRLAAQGDPSKWLVYNVTNYAQDASGYYGVASVSFVNGSAGSGSPFAVGDSVMLFFQRTGDEGKQGPAGINGSMQLLASATVSTAVANIDFLNVFTSAYDTYAVEVQGMLVSSAASMNVWLAKAGAVDTSGVYYSPVGDGTTGTASQTVFAYSGITIPSVGPNSLTATMRFRNTNSTTGNKTVSLQGFSNGVATIKEAGYLGLNTATGFRLSPTNGQNFTAGTIRVYGIKNS